MSQQNKEAKQSSKWRSPNVLSAAICGVLVLVAGAFVVMHFVNSARSLSLSELDQHLRAGRVVEAEFDRDGHSVEVTLDGEDSTHTVDYPAGAEGPLYEKLDAELDDTDLSLITEGASVFSVLSTIAMIAFWAMIMVIFFSLMNALQQLAKRHELDTGEVERPNTTLAEVKGIDEIVARAEEIVAILGDPDRYRTLGARLPKSMILYGPPGTGKTLLARAIAGQVGVPFFRVTAASLMDKWLGSSAKRIKQLYEQARSHDRAIVFVDEIDAIGGSRNARTMGGIGDERNAALTQLLNELDGFDRSNVFTIVATNRVETLDEALTRAGRFDIQLYVPAPDVSGREAILRVHTDGKPLADDVDLRQLARETTGAVGADLEALANEAALTAARAGAEKITQEHFGEALTTIEQGPQRKGVTVNETERKITAYHEAGHTLAAMLQNDMDDPIQVTIVPRGKSGGHSRIAPEEDRQLLSRRQAKAQLVWMMGGRAGEKIHCGYDNFTSGGAGDLQQATALAEHMVCLYGMGTYSTSIPLDTWRESPHAVEVERQVEELLDEAEATAINLLLEHLPALEEMVAGSALRRYAQTTPLTGDDLDQVQGRFEALRDSVRATRPAPVATNGNGLATTADR